MLSGRAEEPQIASPVAARLFHYGVKMEHSFISRGTPLLIEPLCHLFGLRFGQALGSEHDRVVMSVPHAPAILITGWSNDIPILHRSLCTGFSSIMAE